MNYLEAKKRAKEKYEMHLKRIELCKRVLDKIVPALPEGWDTEINDIGFHLSIRKGSVGSNEEVDSAEFKYICSILKQAFPKLDFQRFAHVNDNGKVIFLKAYDYLRFPEEESFLEIEVILFNPKLMPNCKIEWKTETVRRAIVSDECLGIGGK